MEQKIFNLGLSVETVSVYLLCCAIADLGLPVTMEALESRWNAKPEDLQEGLTTLEKMAIVVRSDPQVYLLNNVSAWKII